MNLGPPRPTLDLWKFLRIFKVPPAQLGPLLAVRQGAGTWHPPPNLEENEIGLHISKITHLGPARMSMFSGKFCQFFHVITFTMSCATTRPPKQVHCDFTIIANGVWGPHSLLWYRVCEKKTKSCHTERGSPKW